jgi:hypothetical protein
VVRGVEAVVEPGAFELRPADQDLIAPPLPHAPLCTVEAGQCSGAPGEVMPGWASGWQHFRPRIESSFFRFFWLYLEYVLTVDFRRERWSRPSRSSQNRSISSCRSR